ncbi:MAG: DUF4330 domain-containing protein [Thermoleophilia bacterium]|nr:DUF4330 domain-containing protein [Thermoleophilia bacterium]
MGRLIDDRGRILGKLSVIDLVVFLVIVAVVVFAVVRLTGGASSAVPVRITFGVEQVRQPTVDAIKTGQAVRNDAGTLLGTVKDLTVTPTREEFMTPDGQLRAFDSPVFKDIRIVVVGKAQISDSTLRIGSQPLRVGKKVTLVGMGFEVQTTILGVVWGDDALETSEASEARN